MAVSITDLQFYYAGTDKPVLNIPDWYIETGKSIFLHGASGSGKSTLLNIIAGILPVKHGLVTINGTRLNTLSARQRDTFRATHIGYVFQQFNLIHYLSVLDNIHLAGLVANKKTPMQALEQLLIALRIPKSVWHQPASQLSIGQQQRVAIARALIKKPDLLIVDEPTSSLDQHNRDAFMRLLMEHSADNQVTLLFVSHDEQLMTYFDHVVSLTSINRV